MLGIPHASHSSDDCIDIAVLAFAERVDKCQSAVGKKLLRLMEQKKSNLSVRLHIVAWTTIMY